MSEAEGFALDDILVDDLIVSADRNSAEERDDFGLPAATGLRHNAIHMGANRVARNACIVGNRLDRFSRRQTAGDASFCRRQIE